MTRPLDENNEYTRVYMGQVKDDVMSVLREQIAGYTDLILSLQEKADFAYAPGKWTVKQLVSHTIDTERILCYRLVAFSRGETQNLPGFEQDDYIGATDFSRLELSALAEEFSLLRRANIFFYESLTDLELDKRGFCNQTQKSARALLFTIAGHIEHHRNILLERYV